MNSKRSLKLIAALSALILSGCATIFNGSTQQVPVDVPPGTIVYDWFGNVLPITDISIDTLQRQVITLQRKLDYDLRFKYKRWEIKTSMSSRVQPGWIVADLGSYGSIVDAITGDWCAFDGGVRVHFPDDMKPSGRIELPYLERFEPENKYLTHVNLFGSIGMVGPPVKSDFTLPVMVRGGIGYEASRHLTIFFSASTGYIDLLPRNTILSGNGYFNTYDLGARIRLPDNLYVTAGAGTTSATSDSLQTNVVRLDPQTNRPFNTTQRVGLANTSMGSLFLGLGVSGSFGFLEIRQSFGLSPIPLPLGETGHFASTSIEAGLTFSF